MASPVLPLALVFIAGICRAEIVACPGEGQSCSCNPAISGEPCLINCVGGSQCRNSSITCRSGDDCIINCDGRAACKEAKIACPSLADCTVNCAKNRNICLDLIVTMNNAQSYQCMAPECPAVPAPFTASPSRAPTTNPSTAPTKSVSPTYAPSVNPTPHPSNNP